MLKTFCHLHDEEGIFRFYVGGTLGVDMWAAEQLLYLKEQPGYQDIELIVALPFEGHDSKWDAMSKQRLQIIIHNATKCIVIGQSGTTSDYKKRNYCKISGTMNQVSSAKNFTSKSASLEIEKYLFIIKTHILIQ